MMTFLTLIPLIALLICLMVLKLPVPKSGAISLALALGLAIGFFGMTADGLVVAVGKALWLALFVSLIVWSALMLYHLVSDFGAIDVVNHNLGKILKDKFVAFVLLAWLFTGLLQGLAGFGVPAVIVAPILIALGFNPVKSVAAALLGHSWAVTFGSMGAAYFVIQGLTGIEPEYLRFPLWIFNTTIHLLTGLGVCFLFSGLKGIAKGLKYVLPVSIVMAGVQFALLANQMFHLASIVTAACGLIVMFTLYKVFEKVGLTKPEPEKKVVGKVTKAAKSDKAETSDSKQPNHKLGIVQAIAPYALILILLLSFQAIPAEIRTSHRLAISPAFPETQTVTSCENIFNFGEHSYEFGALHIDEVYTASAVERYNPIRLFVHPVMPLVIASIVACLIYKGAGIWNKKVFIGAVDKTIKKGIPATLALVSLGTMSLIMMDSGMTHRLANATADATGGFFPFMSPLLGVLASFLTGNNTNANVLFGNLQYEIATGLDVSTAMMTASQTMSAGLGVTIGPTLILMAALATKQPENVPQLLKKLIPVVLVIAAVMGVVNYALINNESLINWVYGVVGT
ncbi:MAG: L-lactate permease [Oscillospiraceae bacterium]|nr:L-lactate permease [Oscillospiraceae bacterium]